MEPKRLAAASYTIDLPPDFPGEANLKPRRADRSGLNVGQRVGKFTHIHPVTICIGKYPEKTFPVYGVPNNMWTPKFGDGYGIAAASLIQDYVHGLVCEKIPVV